MNTRLAAADAPGLACRGSELPLPFVPPSMRGDSVITTVEQLRGAATLAALNAHETPPAGNDILRAGGTGIQPKRPPPAAKVGATNRVKESPTTGTSLEGLDDDEFVRVVSSEFRRRGLAVAMRLTPEDTNANRLPTFPFHPSTVSIATQHEENWTAMFLRLKEFMSQNDGQLSSLLATAKSKGCDHQVDLAKWTKNQITAWKRMQLDNEHNLSTSRITRLHSLDVKDFAVDPTFFSRMATKVPCREKSEGARTRTTWDKRYQALLEYKRLHGDTNVPRSYDDTLSKWCHTQRSRCKEMLKGDAVSSVMTEEQFNSLKHIGFDMQVERKAYDSQKIDQMWDDRFNELLVYKAQHGNCDVAVRRGKEFEQCKQLANWASLQRRKYKARKGEKKLGRTRAISDEQIRRLTSIGFQWSLQENFDERFKQLEEYNKRNGHTRVPVFDSSRNNLGRWATRMRDGITNDEPWMTKERKQKLLSLGFDTSARSGVKRKRSDNKPKEKPEDDNVKPRGSEANDNKPCGEAEEHAEEEPDMLLHLHQYDTDLDGIIAAANWIDAVPHIPQGSLHGI